MHLTDLTMQHLPRETDRLLVTAARLDEDDVRGPSLCAGWTRAHVLSHLARNADAMLRVCRSIVTGEADTMYDSVESRDADIAAGAGRSAGELLDDVRATALALAPEIAKVGVEHVGVMIERVPGGPLFPAERVPFMRLREVVWHHVDLDAGYGFADTPDELVHLFLDDAVARLQSGAHPPSLSIRTHEGDSWTLGGGTTELTGPRQAVLFWLARGVADGLDADPASLPVLPFGG